ncbi:MAG: hypothetical protein AUJ92_04135 [Armatimonadetes bacterium CG2_30_59_28]|nr:transcriptional regulator [Armatimonadota bacterium]OIO97186.1 MAG: hypothetical protein AUJ92_04135 [Armatimonadetes bacterium CG2_30_59_28]PIU67043.1 MAG: transcriptional regulator [Armatimonadetes bacterium CG07_land_8_20_14_0_80_59_28]PIX45145.1 MAG: transcriptional regulator [Armatimonadetes bacterium CG_4_8_14_3_um_filter_58_9]PIY44184.1 MAG: transcriptional regulator [Armatimonadetes bacterium CG_4_10_14_3_um_filter_59_10]PJB66068.1 MAG: transcriptional regulator [Armatimonadetes bac
MDEKQILHALDIGEAQDWEFKSAKGGIPGDLWHTYSGMANTEGGTIVLGIREIVNGHDVHGLDDPEKTRKNFWDSVNNRQITNLNLLANHDVQLVTVAGKVVLVIRVPRATRRQRPVYVGQNPMEGTYRRNYEGDYKCRPEDVRRMLTDQTEESQDTRILEHFGVADLDPNSVRQYRNRFSARAPNHAWLTEDEQGFLGKLGAWRKDRVTLVEGLTVAGLLMFGRDEAIRDPAAMPEFHLDYRERLSEEPAVRWTDRLTSDGTWVCNLFQFYERVNRRLTSDLKIPFQLQPDMSRKDDTIVHEAVREALVNALIHADHRGQGGVVIEKYRDRFELSNPGTLLLDVEQVWRGGISECRNKTLQTMFNLIGYGEKAGSGFDKMRQGWASQQWLTPNIEESTRPDRVRVVLPMVSLLPEESLKRLRARFGKELDALSSLEVQSLVTAETESSVSNFRMQQVTTEHPADLTQVLQRLVAKGLLAQVGQKRGTRYELAGSSAYKPGPPSDRLPGTPHIIGVDSTRKEGNSTHKATALPPELDPELLTVAQGARGRRRLPPDETCQIIRDLCRNRYLTHRQLGGILDRNPTGLQERFLRPMARRGELVLRFPHEPNRPDQAYTTGSNDQAK